MDPSEVRHTFCVKMKTFEFLRLELFSVGRNLSRRVVDDASVCRLCVTFLAPFCELDWRRVTSQSEVQAGVPKTPTPPSDVAVFVAVIRKIARRVAEARAKDFLQNTKCLFDSLAERDSHAPTGVKESMYLHNRTRLTCEHVAMSSCDVPTGRDKVRGTAVTAAFREQIQVPTSTPWAPDLPPTGERDPGAFLPKGKNFFFP